MIIIKHIQPLSSPPPKSLNLSLGVVASGFSFPRRASEDQGDEDELGIHNSNNNDNVDFRRKVYCYVIRNNLLRWLEY